MCSSDISSGNLNIKLQYPVKVSRIMAQSANPFNPNRYLVSHNHLHQQHGSHAHQSLQPQPSGFYCGSQVPPPNHVTQSRDQQQQQHNPALSRLHQQQQHPYMMGCYPQNPSGWTGIPLISTAPRRTRKNNFGNSNLPASTKPRILIPNNSGEYDENAMTRLAMHAHGAPLILAGRYRNRVQKRGDTKPQPHPGLAAKKSGDGKISEGNVTNSESAIAAETPPTSSDTSTTGSDENSTNSGNSQETCLPRIIKPRKRRKKDRKPQNSMTVCMSETVPSIPPKNHAESQDFNQAAVTHNVSLSQISKPLSNLDASSPFPGKIPQPANEIGDLPLPDSIAHYYQPQTTANDPMLKLQQSPEEELVGSCCCRICDPSCRIWAFPLRRSCSDNTAELELQKSNKDVGVIGSNRTASSKSTGDWRSPSKNDSNRSLFRNGSFSDSGDSGCDLLSGINFNDDPLFFTGSSNQISSSPIGDDRNFIDFPTAETLLTESINEISKKLMETVDLRSDIFASDSSSVFSDSVLSDDMLINIENLARSCNHSLNGNHILNSSNNSVSLTYPTNGDTCVGSDLFNDLQHFQQLQQQQQQQPIVGSDNRNSNMNSNCSISNINCNYLLSGISGDNNNSNSTSSNCNNNFVMFHEKDRENEIFNCFDMVWSRNDNANHHHHLKHHNQHHNSGFGVGGFNGSGNLSNGAGDSSSMFVGVRQLLPIEEQRIQLQTTG